LKGAELFDAEGVELLVPPHAASATAAMAIASLLPTWFS
jgi:hypothetical protein